MTNWPAGRFFADWYDPATGAPLGNSQTTTVNGGLALPLPDYSADLAAVLYPPPRFSPVNVAGTNGFQFLLNSETGGHYLIQQSFDLVHWAPYLNVTNATGAMVLSIPSGGTNGVSFFRAFRAG